MVPESFHDFFLAEAGASGALVGLLFVAISVRPERVVGDQSQIVEQARASSALTALVTPLILALVALIGVDRAWALIGGRGRGRATSLVDLVRGDDSEGDAKQ